MAKHPVPKQKVSKGRSNRRYKDFKNKTILKLTNRFKFEDCHSCGAKKIIHHVCPLCGKYKGKKIIDKGNKIEKVTKIKA